MSYFLSGRTYEMQSTPSGDPHLIVLFADPVRPGLVAALSFLSRTDSLFSLLHSKPHLSMMHALLNCERYMPCWRDSFLSLTSQGRSPNDVIRLVGT